MKRYAKESFAPKAAQKGCREVTTQKEGLWVAEGKSGAHVLQTEDKM